MCYSGVALVNNLRDLTLQRRWDALQASIVGVASAEAAEVAGEGSSGPRVKQYCLCSPTQHPGSFRCRQHQAEYSWADALRILLVSGVFFSSSFAAKRGFKFVTSSLVSVMIIILNCNENIVMADAVD
ncbi:hypothetical protein F8388_012807 [Cannabis sativa]|uniref:Uncharacterized protein n=1 Tax=Cannabis sativa TaxID=3483 RepID=A0A7J6F3Z2_CANSA|nr:hypothetical protein F8388_012807 [Cannabis sativa]